VLRKPASKCREILYYGRDEAPVHGRESRKPSRTFLKLLVEKGDKWDDEAGL
jgi:hypothetical protein